MNQEEIFAKLQELIGQGNLEAAQNFFDEHKENLGDLASQASNLLENAGGVSGIMDKAQEFIGNPEGLSGLADKFKNFFGN
ncbi:hypothetical protein ACYSNU_14840 [Enterococcus sp. LJL120]